MTNERAIEILNPEHREHYPSIEPVNEACRMGMKALEKQIPKKPIQTDYKIKALDVESNKVVTFICARCSCGKFIVQKTNNKFCEHCGQALDWS